ncbi:hypothetical protein EVG20_g5443 [Dentipellis fragilis]|uniref:VTT domain-containing protein n=1 Tax=Dentipellis fragilis TaxID=205917 RepID=A0A4Y9YV75_9AGAM|nr:hypothetical protein EVG20_g5443 [Dentipellis fragilis]
MATLAPPPSRHRASSTNLRPALTLHTLGTRAKNCLFEDVPCTPPPSVNNAKVSSPLQPPSKLSLVAARCWALLHMDSSLTYPSAPSSPRSSSDETILPLSAVSTHPPSVGDMFEPQQDSSFPRASPRLWWQRTPSVCSHFFTFCTRPTSPPYQVHAPILFVITLFPVSTALVILSFWSLPFTFSWPSNLADLAQLGRELHGYSQSGVGAMTHVIGIISIATIWMHACRDASHLECPRRALFSPLMATVLLSILTTVGSIFASLLATPLSPFLTRFFPRPLALARSAFESDADVATGTKSPAWVRLSVLRLVGVVPWSGINVACGVCGVALYDCLLGTFIGSIPWTAVTCQIGDILQTVAATPSPNPQTISSVLASPDIIIKLVFLSFLSLAPILGRDYLRAWISSAGKDALSSERTPRWAWVKEWRAKVRIPSRSRSRSQGEKETEALTLEMTEKLQQS